MRNSTLLAKGIHKILYPNPCAVCSKKQSPGADAVCIKCSYALPKTDFHLEDRNEFTNRFWGRLNLHSGAAAYFFHKKGSVQRLIHQFKYKNRPEIGFLVGYSYGLKLTKSPLFNTVERIVPVPLHPSKQRKRGFNQSNLFADGLSAAMGVLTLKETIIRTRDSESQTLKGNIERLENVDEVFRVVRPEDVEGKHILLVDDVMTTGSTLEACALPILRVKNTEISMATMAIAMN